jgi:hypothetical protein
MRRTLEPSCCCCLQPLHGRKRLPPLSHGSVPAAIETRAVQPSILQRAVASVQRFSCLRLQRFLAAARSEPCGWSYQFIQRCVAECMVSRVAGPVDIRERVQGGWQNTWLGSEPCGWSYAGKECTVGDEMHGSGVHGVEWHEH